MENNESNSRSMTKLGDNNLAGQGKAGEALTPLTSIFPLAHKHTAQGQINTTTESSQPFQLAIIPNTPMTTMNALTQPQLMQPLDIQNATYMQLCDFLRRITEIIIHYKDHLPDDSRHLLSTTFSKAKSTERPPPRATEVRNLIEQIRPVDVEPQGAVLKLIRKCKESPSTFWTDNLPEKPSLGSGNILSRIYWQIRDDEKLSVIYKAFYTTAIYLMIRDIRKTFEVKTLTAKVKRHCSNLIMNQQNNPEEREKVEKTLSNDYTAGLAWEKYAASLGGYGAFFLMGLIPPWKYEVTLNKSDDLQFVVSHFKSIKVPETAERYELHDLGYLILSEVRTRIYTCIPPTVSTRKRKRPKKKAAAASASVPHQTEDVASFNSARISSKRVRLNRSSASHRQTSASMMNSSNDSRSVFYEEGNGEFQQVEALSQSTLATSSVEAPGHGQRVSRSYDSGLQCSNHQNTSSWPIHPGGVLYSGTGSSWRNYQFPEQQPERPTAGLIGREQNSTYQDPDSHLTESTVEPVEHPVSSARQTTNTTLNDNAKENHVDVTVPSVPYHPGLFNTSYVCPYTSYEPVHRTSDTEVGHFAQAHNMDATIPFPSYNPGLFNTLYEAPSTSHQPVHNPGDMDDFPVLPLELFDSTLSYQPGLFNTSDDIPQLAYQPGC